jgi:hypothetical protein
MRHRLPLLAILALLTTATSLRAQEAPTTQGSLAKMPVTEVTIFKDGHALLLHSGKMPTDKDGNVTLDYLPSPVLGTFWSATTEKTAKLNSVTASQHRVAITRTALAIRELLEANVGAEVTLKMMPDNTSNPRPVADLVGTIAAIPQRSAEELEATSPPNTPHLLPQKGNILLLKNDAGTRVLDINRIQEVIFKNDLKVKHTDEELRNLLTLKLNWENNKPQPTADVSMMYLQKGIRWIPSYKIIIDGNGNATVRLQATLINELHDLKDVTANLVVGVPSFAFSEQTDPIALAQAVAPLSQHFRRDMSTSNMLSNAIMSQRAGAMVVNEPAAPAAPDLGPELGTSKKNEDLYIFPLTHVTLKKGDRMVVPLREFKIAYKDVYKLDLPFTPPPEIWRTFQTQQQAEIARLARAPKFMHTLRLSNKTDAPLTTAPALIIKDDKVLAQAMMTYTPSGADVDVALTTAIDIQVEKTDKETKRTPNAEVYDGHEFMRIDLDGTIKITNHNPNKVDLEITRNLLGQVDKADNDGKPEMLNLFEDRSYTPATSEEQNPYWWGWYNWPAWWSRFNGIGRVTWKASLDPAKSLELKYQWHYFWR